MLLTQLVWPTITRQGFRFHLLASPGDNVFYLYPDIRAAGVVYRQHGGWSIPVRVLPLWQVQFTNMNLLSYYDCL